LRQGEPQPWPLTNTLLASLNAVPTEATSLAHAWLCAVSPDDPRAKTLKREQASADMRAARLLLIREIAEVRRQKGYTPTIARPSEDEPFIETADDQEPIADADAEAWQRIAEWEDEHGGHDEDEEA
jgi:hypothetical protein